MLGARFCVDIESSFTALTLAEIVVGYLETSTLSRKGGTLLLDPMICIDLALAPGITTVCEDLDDDDTMRGLAFSPGIKRVLGY